jgi:UDPglucose 6-dehydrogenase
MRVCVLGMWHLGSVTAACLASLGHHVTGVDYDEDVVGRLSRGVPPVYEPDLAELVTEGLEAGRLDFSSDPSLMAGDAELVWIAYDTPVDENDIADVEFVLREVEKIVPFLQVGATVLVSSQMPVGSVARLEKLASEVRPGGNIGFACSPENLRLGQALRVFLHPDRVVVGVRRDVDRLRLEAVLETIGAPVEWMSVESAEMTKHAINSFLATSVVFANEIASLCEKTGADAKEVERGLKSEQRIGFRAYLSPGGAFAGGTLARDVEFLNVLGREHGTALPLLESVGPSNDHHKRWAHRKLADTFGSLHGVCVAVWGLTYKPGTDTLRRSLSVELCDWLLMQGAVVRVHDPVVLELPRHWKERVTRYDSPLDALVGCRALVIGTEWPEYRDLDLGELMVAVPKDILILDANRVLAPLGDVQSLRYLAVGTPLSGEES